jgi:hypothetical protein
VTRKRQTAAYISCKELRCREFPKGLDASYESGVFFGATGWTVSILKILTLRAKPASWTAHVHVAIYEAYDDQDHDQYNPTRYLNFRKKNRTTDRIQKRAHGMFSVETPD